MRVGGSELIDVDFRLIAATNKDLEKEIAEGRFREDLYYRLKVVTLKIPPLRERRDDMPRLAEHYLSLICREHGREAKRFSREALGALSAYAWPGNVRELRNADRVGGHLPSRRRRPGERPAAGGPGLRRGVRPRRVRPRTPERAGETPAERRRPQQRAVASADGDRCRRRGDRRLATCPQAPRGTKTMDEIERDAILAALDRTGGRRVEAAKLLDIGLRTLQRKLKDYKDQGYYQE